MFKWNLVWAACATLFMILLLILAVLGFRAYMQHQIVLEAEKVIRHGGVSEVERLRIGGVEQYMLMEGQDLSKPVCLFLQEDPGSPVPFGVSARAQFSELTKSCIAVYWDRRGTGKSRHQGMEADSISSEQFINDAGEVIDYLRDKYARDRVFVVGHASGAGAGTELAKRYPEKLYGYIGWGPLSHVTDNRGITQVWIKRELNRRMNGLEIRQIVFSPDYTLRDIYNIFASRLHIGLRHSQRQEVGLPVNLLEGAKDIQVPLYFFQGEDLNKLCSEWTRIFDETAYL